MDTGDFIEILAWLTAGAIAGAICAFTMFRRARLIEDTPTSRIRSAAQGHVELEGIARLLPGEPIIAPLSKAECVWWEYAIKEKRGSGKHSKWVTIDSGTSQEMFELVDDTDRCIIDPEKAKVIPDVKLKWYGSTAWPQRVPGTNAKFGFGFTFGFGRYSYSEKRITAGKALYALGWFRTDGGAAQTFDSKAEIRDLLSEWKTDAAKMREFDSDGDGQVDMAEWARAREAAAAVIRDKQTERVISPNLHVLCRPPRRLKFLLSTIPQEQLIKRSRRFAIGGLLLFLGCGSVAFALVMERGWLG